MIESKASIQKETVYLEEITSHVVTNLKQAHGEKCTIGVDLSIEKSWANPSLLEQVMTNLIDNAFKYTPQGGRIAVSWKRREIPEPMDVLTVADTGPGIPKEYRPRIFEAVLSC